MNAQELILHIAANLGRLARWAIEGRNDRIDQFLRETERCLEDLRRQPAREEFKSTLDRFWLEFHDIRTAERRDIEWAERVATWANILTHRAKLA